MSARTLAPLAASLVLVLACGGNDAPPKTGGDAPVSSAPAASASAAPVASASPMPAASASAAPASSAAPAAAAPEIAVGKPAPAVEMKAQDGRPVKLAALKGRPVVVYFYPKDETPGCTKEACSFRDAWADLAKTNVVLIGVSTDTVESHKAFAAHWKLPFHLVSDPDGSIAKAFGVPNNGGVLARQTVVIDKDGNVKKIYREVDVSKHAADVLADVR